MTDSISTFDTLLPADGRCDEGVAINEAFEEFTRFSQIEYGKVWAAIDDDSVEPRTMRRNVTILLAKAFWSGWWEGRKREQYESEDGRLLSTRVYHDANPEKDEM